MGDAKASPEASVRHPAALACAKARLQAHRREAHGASNLRGARAMLMTDLPSIDGNEPTDKGCINQRAGL
jgi:feruloyl-CoA synthase